MTAKQDELIKELAKLVGTLAFAMRLVSPKLAAIAACLDEAHRRATEVEERSTPGDPAGEAACQSVFREVSRLEQRLAKAAGISLEDLKVKAKFVDADEVDSTVGASIIEDLHRLAPPRPRYLKR
jgi:hypothetical protein